MPSRTSWRSYHGTALMNRVGHAFIKRRMREENAIFGGEVTGHYYFRDYYYADNGFIPALLILELMSSTQHDASRSARAAARRSTSSPAKSTPGSAASTSSTRRLQRIWPSSTATATPTSSTASRPSSRTGTSTSADRTRSRCSASISKRHRRRSWSRSGTRCWRSSGREETGSRRSRPGLLCSQGVEVPAPVS